MSIVDVTTLEYTEAERYYILKVIPTVITDDIKYRDLHGEVRDFKQLTPLFLATNVFEDSRGGYSEFPTKYHRKFLLTQEQAEKLIEIDEDYYIMTSSENDLVHIIQEGCIVKYPHMTITGKVRAGDCIVKISDEDYLYVGRQRFKSMYRTKEKKA